MNARLLTMVFLICSLGIAKFVMGPKLKELSSEQLRISNLEKEISAAKRDQIFVLSLPESQSPRESIDVVTVQALSRLHHTYQDFGIVISDVSGGSSVGGQNVVPLQVLQGQNASTPLKTQEISIKGNYESLEDFQRFVDSQIIDFGGSIGAIKLKGTNFDMKVQLFGLPEKAGS